MHNKIDPKYYWAFGQEIHVRDYDLFGKKYALPNSFVLVDHHYGYDKDLRNELFEKLDKKKHTIITHNITDEKVKKNYPCLNFKFSPYIQYRLNLRHFENYKDHPQIDYKNFICSFNGSAHISRHLLSSILANQGYFNLNYCSKNFSASDDRISGYLHSLDLTEEECELYYKFFKNTDNFHDTTYSFGHIAYDHGNNIYNLEPKLTQSFVHLVSETMATSYHPFVTEKFLYSIVTRGLFVAYAQPGWHAHIKKYYGFKLYDKIFDYSFDSIQNPIKRLVKLIEMLSKFSTLSADDWLDLYSILERDTIEFNYQHYYTGDYMKFLQEYE